MKKNLSIIVASIVLTGTLSLTLPSAFADGTNAPAAGEKHHHNERHPAIHAAIRNLEEAKHDLERADHDFGGHRKAALEACDNAIAQLREALNYDKK
ncbi:hypothetical protein [Pedosphaera parvula]|nr:hypothetical protein [Pedosphaera parvula]